MAVIRVKERIIAVDIKSNWKNQQYFKITINTLLNIDTEHI